LESDGIAAEVLFPNGVPYNEGLGEGKGVELRAAGARAYNRWLADFCSLVPERRAGLALVPLVDVDAAVGEVHWAREHGLRGVVMPTSWQAAGIPPYYDPRYEPFWAACAEQSMPVHAHGGAADVAGYGDYGPESMLTFALEATCFFAQRPFWYLMWGGVFERHPGLTLVLTESRADWVPYILFFCDRLYRDKLFAHIKEKVKQEPSAYFRRNVVLGASMMNRHEAEMRHEIGIEKLMWGADYPHYEGTWPASLEWQKSAFAGLPVDDVQTILAGNAARVYGFEMDTLQPVAERVGPRVDEIRDATGDVSVWRW
jgi:predicted TIM-barrel fold metal-dependent hydrolase